MSEIRPFDSTLDLARFDSLIELMKSLRDPKTGCPWDLEQTHSSLTTYAIEEVHELVDAIERENVRDTVEELGDVLLQVVFHAEIGRQLGTFTIGDVIRAISEKLVRRHPHVFGEASAKTVGEVLDQWESTKAQEKASVNEHEKGFNGFGVPVTMPALQRAQKIGEKTKKAKFDWNDAKGAFEKVFEEVGELKAALSKSDSSQQQHEIGDLLFSIAQLARHLGHDSEKCLRQANLRFERRYKNMVALAARKRMKFEELPSKEKEALWTEAKLLEKYSEGQ